eukprot:1138757-Pelagomonas_calceolata.AAC.5
MASGMGPRTCSIIARCSKFSWVWNRASPVDTHSVTGQDVLCADKPHMCLAVPSCLSVKATSF